MDQNGIKKEGRYWLMAERQAYRKFIPTREIQKKVGDYVLKHNIENCSAMHLRQTDMHLILKPAQRATLESYDRFIDTRPINENIYLMTDNPAGQKRHVDKYGDRILFYSRILPLNNTVIGGNPKINLQKNLLRDKNDKKTFLPSSYRFTSLEHTLIDILISSHALIFKGSPFSSLSDLVNIYRHFLREDKKGKE